MYSARKESLLPPLWILIIILVSLAIWLIIALKEIVALMVIGYCIAYAIEPLVRFAERRGASRIQGIFLVAFMACIIAAILLITAIPPLIQEAQELIANLPDYVQTVREKLSELFSSIGENENNPLHSLVASPLNAFESFGKEALPKVLSALYSVLLGGYSITLTVVNAALLPFIVFYLSADFPAIKSFFLGFFPASRQEKVSKILSEIDGYVSSFVRGQFLVCTVLFTLYAAGLGIVGVDLWFVLAFISGYGNLIPYLGFLVGILLTSIMTIVTFGDFYHLILVWVIYAAVQMLEGTFITPKILGNSVGLSPLAIILAIVAGGTLFGLLGIFLAVPGAAVIRVLAKYGYQWLLDKSEA